MVYAYKYTVGTWFIAPKVLLLDTSSSQGAPELLTARTRTWHSQNGPGGTLKPRTDLKSTGLVGQISQEPLDYTRPRIAAALFLFFRCDNRYWDTGNVWSLQQEMKPHVAVSYHHHRNSKLNWSKGELTLFFQSTSSPNRNSSDLLQEQLSWAASSPTHSARHQTLHLQRGEVRRSTGNGSKRSTTLLQGKIRVEIRGNKVPENVWFHHVLLVYFLKNTDNGVSGVKVLHFDPELLGFLDCLSNNSLGLECS